METQRSTFACHFHVPLSVYFALYRSSHKSSHKELKPTKFNIGRNQDHLTILTLYYFPSFCAQVIMTLFNSYNWPSLFLLSGLCNALPCLEYVLPTFSTHFIYQSPAHHSYLSSQVIASSLMRSYAFCPHNIHSDYHFLLDIIVGQFDFYVQTR